MKPATAEKKDFIIPASSASLTHHGTRSRQSEPENGDDAQSRTGQERCRWAIGVPQHACEDIADENDSAGDQVESWLNWPTGGSRRRRRHCTMRCMGG